MPNVIVIGPRDPRLTDGEIVVNTTSRSKDWGKGLSPFILGPCELYDGLVSKTMENAWQYAKVYKTHVDENNDPTKMYWAWAKDGWRNAWASRYPMGKGAIPEYSLWNGERLTYIQARKKIYVPLYYKAVKDTEAFQRLRYLYENTELIYLWDFDGYNNIELGMSLKDVINHPTKKMGHAFVLANMLKRGE